MSSQQITNERALSKLNKVKLHLQKKITALSIKHITREAERESERERDRETMTMGEIYQNYHTYLKENLFKNKYILKKII